MKPYYEDGSVTIYHGSYLDFLPLLSKPADALITDPPYGMGHYADDNDLGLAELLDEWISDTKVVTGPVAMFGYPERLVWLCAEAKAKPDEWITWWPTNAAIKAFNFAGLFNESECIAVFGKHHFSELRQERGENSQRILTAVRDVFSANSRGDSHGEDGTRRVGDVWTDVAPGLAFNSHQRLHPNQKPLTVMTRLVAGLTREGETVLDPFMGSGTTLLAAKQLGRKAIGIDIQEKYCEVAVKRLAQETLGLAG